MPNMTSLSTSQIAVEQKHISKQNIDGLENPSDKPAIKTLLSLPPIRRLPVETLSWIFILSVFSPDFDDRESCYKHPMVFRISHVCRQWRLISLQCPELWSKLCPDSVVGPWSISYTRALLERSKQFPLTIDIQPLEVNEHDSRYLRKAIRLALKHAERARVLHLDDHYGEKFAVQIVKRLSVISAPHLESFRFGLSERLDIKHPLFQGGGTPKLRHLGVRYHGLESLPPLPSQLVTLDLDRPHRTVSVSEMLSVLSKLPYLEIISLWACLQPDSPPVDNPVRFNHLTLVSIADAVSNCVAMMENLIPTHPIKISVKRLDWDAIPNWRPVGCLFERIGTRLNFRGEPGYLPLRTLSVKLTMPNRRVQGWVDVQCNPHRTNVSPYLDIGLSGIPGQHEEYTFRRRSNTWILRSCKLLQLFDVQVLYVSSKTFLPTDSWLNAFEGATQVHRLEIDEAGALVGFLKAILTPNEEYGQDKLFPALKTMFIREVDFEHKYRIGDGVSTTVGAALLDFLKKRASEGSRLELLWMEDCYHLPNGARLALLEHVDKAFWERYDVREVGSDPEEMDKFHGYSDEDSDSDQDWSDGWGEGLEGEDEWSDEGGGDGEDEARME
ncbi:hypothetical protein JAAARDRAFT_538527 [Jaapia argillacea MUCL 33604]|uniref:Uncharacterized protein n=1 Tax=Jaapia argillacea MUCL 33604 TaxID=933084 RepID=A0A067P8A5_9AGAM|nr:hypothetical protein JAAARDRAFT_538527 [Jaapia argillacea MUCL 33604]